MLGVVALEGANLAGKVHFVGFDANDTLLSGLRDKKIAALAVQDPFGMGKTAVEHLVKTLKGEEVPKLVDTGANLLTVDNIDSEEMQELLNRGK